MFRVCFPAHTPNNRHGLPIPGANLTNAGDRLLRIELPGKNSPYNCPDCDNQRTPKCNEASCSAGSRKIRGSISVFEQSAASAK